MSDCADPDAPDRNCLALPQKNGLGPDLSGYPSLPSESDHRQNQTDKRRFHERTKKD